MDDKAYILASSSKLIYGVLIVRHAIDAITHHEAWRLRNRPKDKDGVSKDVETNVTVIILFKMPWLKLPPLETII